MKIKSPRRNVSPEYRTLNGRRVVILDVSEYDRLRVKAEEGEPLMPEPDAEGNYPAAVALRVSLARKIIRHRRRVGLTQVELARKAGIRPETLNRLEHGKHSPSLNTVKKLERALEKATASGLEKR